VAGTITCAERLWQTAERGVLARIGWAALILATLYIGYFSYLGTIGFVGPDEPRYAWIARDMAETGDWVTPRLYGRPWFEKPPLYYWEAAVSFKLFGVSEAAARLPSAFSALLATLGLAWLAWRVHGPGCARWLLLLLPTTVGTIGFSHAAATDMPFSAMVTLAMVIAAVPLGFVQKAPGEVLDVSSGAGASATPGSHIASLLAFGFLLGLAVLAKGPAGVILCGGAVFLWALLTKRWRTAFRLLHPVAVAAFCATALPWYILCARRNPDFFRVFIVEHNFKRYLTPEFQHIQPWWYYAPILLIALLPWTITTAVDGKLPNASGETPEQKNLRLLLLCFALFTSVFFTISKSKLPGYILPAVLPLAFLLAVGIARKFKERRSEKRTALAFAATILALAAGLFRYAWVTPLGADILPAPWTLGVCAPLFLGALTGFVLILRRKAFVAAIAMQIALLLAILGLGSGLRWMDPQLSARGVLAVARRSGRESLPANVLVYRVPRGIWYGLNFYLHREIPEWDPAKAAGDLRTVVFAPYSKIKAAEQAGFSCPDAIVFPAAFACRREPALSERPDASEAGAAGKN
jgi:4-amino-4-deoxy-L-arabinose transferase-like glycosyltransferase